MGVVGVLRGAHTQVASRDTWSLWSCTCIALMCACRPVSAPHETCLIENIVAAVASGAKAKQLPASVGELPAAPAMSGSAQVIPQV